MRPGAREEYHDLVATGTRVPLYTLMRDWVFREYDAPIDVGVETEAPQAPVVVEGPVLDITGLR